MKYLAAFFALAFVLAGFTSGAGSDAPPPTSPWPMMQHDDHHTGKSTASGPSGTSVAVQWTHLGVSWIKNQPSLMPDGQSLMIGEGRAPFCSLDTSNGVPQWCTAIGGFVDESSPTIGNPFVKNGRTLQTIYMGDRNNVFWAVDSDGNVLWKYKIHLDGDVHQSAIIAPDHTVYMMCGCTTRGVVHAFTESGALKWVVNLPNTRLISPVGTMVNGHYRLYVLTNLGVLYAIDDLGSTGNVAWTLTLGAKQALHGSPAIGPDGTIYIAAQKGLYAVEDHGPSGSVRPGWPFAPAKGLIDTTPAISDGKLYVSSYYLHTRTLYAIDLTTTVPKKLWSITGAGGTAADYTLPPNAVVGANGLVYQAIGPDIYAFDPSLPSPATAPRWHATLPNYVISMTIGDGVLYVSDMDFNVYALR
jgi:hypothetical protein